MKGVHPGDKVAEIKGRVDIVELISEYVPLKKAGRNFLGLCPFHSEKTPSFTVNREKQMFYCFGCGEKGDAFAFLMRLNNATFPETLKLLAQKTGVVLPASSFHRDGKYSPSAREQIIRINSIAAAYFTANLFSQNGKAALHYLKERGLKESTIEAFGLGYASDGWRYLKNHLEQQKVSLKLAADAGLIVIREDRSEVQYDRFRHRLMFPVKDVDGRIIAFGGRILGNGEPKYLNSPESAAYSKGRQLYGLNQAKETIRQKGYAILVEGYFDLIVLWDAGIRNVVATLGTALTKDHISLLKRYTERVAVLFDSDEAGKKALARSVEMFVAAHMDARAVVLPEGLDPDDFVRRSGGAALERLVEEAPSIVDYYIDSIIGGGTSFQERGEAAVRAATFITGIEDVIDRNLFIKRVSEKLGIDQDILKKEVNSRLYPKMRKEVQLSRQPKKETVGLEFNLIHLMMECPSVIPSVVESKVMEYFLDRDLKSLGQAWTDHVLKEKNMAPGDALSFLQRPESSAIAETLMKLLFQESPFSQESLGPLCADMIRQVKRRWYKEQHKNIKERLINAQTSGNSELGRKLLMEKERLMKEEKEL
ncbi:DNA primase [Syntrophus gentianae]|uniref:DNA primase n=1 Tax=Syntrophus gentianae TaxID=43775 RepID=A0A1H7UA19_9BACT|nr:DNA primase [Syntrophus gentianae]SEL93127.1 DNA primase [Syntrophus gentianae]